MLKSIFKVFGWVAFASVLFATLGVFLGLWQIPMMALDREIMKQSYQRTEGQTDRLLSLEAEVQRINVQIAQESDASVKNALRGQKNALEHQLRDGVAKLRGNVPQRLMKYGG